MRRDQTTCDPDQSVDDLTKRETMAAMILSGLVGGFGADVLRRIKAPRRNTQPGLWEARTAVRLADALITVLNEE